MSHRFVQAELLADQHQRTADDRAHVRHRLTHKGFELALVDLRYPPKNLVTTARFGPPEGESKPQQAPACRAVTQRFGVLTTDRR
jgi:hypothetical protein